MNDDTQQREDCDEQADERLLASLRAIANRVDAVPDSARLAARSQFAYLSMDADLAELTFDSTMEPEPAGVRSDGIRMRSDAATVRRLTFEAGATVLEVEVVPDGARRRLVGQCVPAAEAALLVRCRPTDAPGVDAEPFVILSTTDDLGRFDVEIPAGEVLLRCVWHAAGLAVETSWVRA